MESKNGPPSLLSASIAAMTLLALTACRHATFPDYPAGYREFAYIANETANTVTVLDLVYLRPDRTLLVGKRPVALAVNPLRNEVYALNAQPEDSAGSVSVIDTASNAVVASMPVHHAPSALAVDPAGKRAYVVNAGSNTVTVLDLDTRRAVFSAPTGAGPAAVAVAADGRSVVVANKLAGTISVFGIAATGAPLSLRTTFAGCPGATAIAILPDSSKAFIACSGAQRVLALGLAQPAESWNAKQDPSLTADHLLATLRVGDTPSHLTLKPDGGEIFVSNFGSDTISEISTTNNEVGSTYAIGDGPSAGVVSGDNSALWIANAGGESISLYSIADGQFLSSLRTGVAPAALAFSADEHLLLAADRASGDVALIRTTSKLGPALYTLMAAGSGPCAIVVKAMQAKP